TCGDENNGSGFIAENSGSLVIGSNLSRENVHQGEFYHHRGRATNTIKKIQKDFYGKM
ncbi:hypothetical protein L9F63_015309, partial [Diploptera punctata]